MSKIFERSALTQSLVDYCRQHDKGARLTYVELSKMVGDEINARSGHLRYARHILVRDHNQVWVAVKPNVGIARLKDAEIARRLPSWYLEGARRRLNRGSNESEVVDIKNLSIDEQARFSVHSIQQHLTLQTLGKSALKNIEKVARGTSNDLPSFNIVEWAFSLVPTRKG